MTYEDEATRDVSQLFKRRSHLFGLAFKILVLSQSKSFRESSSSLSRRGAVVKGVEHISTNVLVNI